jgi:hypothetical protein
MSDVFDRVRQHWLNEDAGIATKTATQAEIDEWERRYSAVLADDLREYVTELNGTLNAEALEFGNGLTSFFPMSSMVPENKFYEQFTSTNMFVFADYLISSHWWLAEVTDQRRERTRIFVRGSGLKLVAESLEEFLEAYMADAPGIYPS